MKRLLTPSVREEEKFPSFFLFSFYFPLNSPFFLIFFFLSSQNYGTLTPLLGYIPYIFWSSQQTFYCRLDLLWEIHNTLGMNNSTKSEKLFTLILRIYVFKIESSLDKVSLGRHLEGRFLFLPPNAHALLLSWL